VQIVDVLSDKHAFFFGGHYAVFLEAEDGLVTRTRLAIFTLSLEVVNVFPDGVRMAL